jgi:enamine deaminase RidA (YjgF/YER057c/UK114 family)
MLASIRHDPFPVGERYRGIYAHGVETRAGARILHISGQVGATPEGGCRGFRGQCEQALSNVAGLNAANATLATS